MYAPADGKFYIDTTGTIDEKIVSTVKETDAVIGPIVTPVAETKPTITEDSDDFDKIFSDSPMAYDPTKVGSVIDLPKELAWFHKRFGAQNVKESNKLLTIAADGRQAFSVFTSDCIYIFTGAPEGALYHEAFHRVFLGYLSEEDRDRVYASARKQFGNLTDIELSEKMAEDFRMYRLTGVKPKSRTISQFFADLFNFIYTFFTGRTKLHSYEIDKLYDSINRSQFRYSKITTENAKLLEKVETPMAIDLRKTTIPVFNNYRELDKTVMFLLSTLIHTNQLDDLNNIENIKMSKMWTELENIRARVEGQINATQKKLDDNLYPKEEVESRVAKLQTMTNFVNILKTVDDVAFKPLFVEKLTDYLNMLNVKVTMG